MTISVGWLLLLFVAHYLGDFVFQRREVAIKKTDSIWALVEHGSWLVVPIAIVMICMSESTLTYTIFIIILYVALHMAQDFYLWNAFKNKAETEEWRKGTSSFETHFFYTLGLDQMLHMIVIVLLASTL